jgi:hypothetical protein
MTAAMSHLLAFSLGGVECSLWLKRKENSDHMDFILNINGDELICTAESSLRMEGNTFKILIDRIKEALDAIPYTDGADVS